MLSILLFSLGLQLSTLETLNYRPQVDGGISVKKCDGAKNRPLILMRILKSYLRKNMKKGMRKVDLMALTKKIESMYNKEETFNWIPRSFVI